MFMISDKSTLTEWFAIRQLQVGDIPQYLQILANLTEVKTDLVKARRIYEKDIVTNPLHKIFVAIDKRNRDNNQLVACCTLLVEPKFIGNANRVGHIEDVAVAKEYQRMGVGSRIVDFVTMFGFEKMKCTKVQLDCSELTMPFYEKLGYIYNDILMKRFKE